MKDTAHKVYHQYLLDRMADLLGLDLGLEVDLTRLSRAKLEQAIARCSQCPDSQGCELWLEEHAGGATNAPEICRNKAMLEHLRGSF